MVCPMENDSSVPVSKHAAVNFRLDIEIVGDFEVVDDRLENLVNFSRRRQQTGSLQAVEHVDFGLMLPFALGFDRGAVFLFCARLILNGIGGLDGEFAELFLVAGGSSGRNPTSGSGT